jgi:hypothetical protein
MLSNFLIPSFILVDLSQDGVLNDVSESTSSVSDSKARNGSRLQDRFLNTQGCFSVPLPIPSFSHEERNPSGCSSTLERKDFEFQIADFSFDSEDTFGEMHNFIIDSCEENPNLTNEIEHYKFSSKNGAMESATKRLPLGRPLAPPPRLPMMIFKADTPKRKVDCENRINQVDRKVRLKCQS